MPAASPPPSPPQPPPPRTTLWQEITSVLAAFFGVQSRRNRERDFQGGNARRFVLLGRVMTLLFVLALYAVVQLVLRSARL